ncbi:MAG: LamB/YcsF family protein [Limisphaerales bacterium]
MRLPPISCDLGEGESPSQPRWLMSLVDEANIACGGHAGDDESIASCLVLARAEQVRPGAHPGIPDRASLGRASSLTIRPSDLTALLDEQVGRLLSVADGLGIAVHHIKLHGALYHLVDEDPALGAAYLHHVAARWPGLAVVTRANGGLLTLPWPPGLRWVREAFLDRGYRADGTLVPRGQPGDLLAEPDEVLARLHAWRLKGSWPAVDGHQVTLEPDTFCVHGDSPNAIAVLRRIRSVHPRQPLPKA